MKIAKVLGLFAMAGMASYAAPGQACSRVATNNMFDSFYAPLWGCQQVFINDMWARFHFNHDDWDQGFGYEDPCNEALPLKRTFNGLIALAYSGTTTPTCSTASSNVLLWGYCWSGSSIDELDGRCGETPRARTTHSLDDYTELFMPFFFDETVVERAATIFHEARHASGWCHHTDNCHDGVDSCDPNWSNGCVGFGSGSGPGANAYTVVYLSWFASNARAGWVNSSIRANAVAAATHFLNSRFETDPCFRLNSAGVAFSTC
jgi:hypothetical protein